MEKFSKWRDPGTGIAPFLPAANGYSGKSGAVIAAETVFSVTSVLIKLPLVVAVALVHLALCWSPIGQYTLRLLMFVSGIWSVKLIEDRKNATRPRPGDVIVSNHTSPLDPLVYATMFKSVFVLPNEKGNGFAQVSALGAMLNALDFPKQRQPEPFEKLVKRAKDCGAVVVLFGEGMTSNGRGLLSVAKIPASTVSSIFYPAAVKYTPVTVITATPTYFIVWLWRLLGIFAGVTVNVKVGIRVAGTGDDVSVSNEIAEGISRAGRLRRVGDYLDSESKREFVVAWNRYHR